MRYENIDWLAPTEADEYDWATDAIGHDLNSYYIFESLADAVEWIESYNSHQSAEACYALGECLAKFGHVTEANHDDQ